VSAPAGRRPARARPAPDAGVVHQESQAGTVEPTTSLAR